MPKFKNLNDLEAYLQKNVHHVMNRSAELERVLADTMALAVWQVVYDAYEPESYNRREDDDGLADTRNMVINSVTVTDEGVKLIFENIAQGNDTLSRTFLTDTIVEGIKENWNYSGSPWSEPRDFVGETAKRLRENPEEIVEAIKNGLKKKKFKFKESIIEDIN